MMSTTVNARLEALEAKAEELAETLRELRELLGSIDQAIQAAGD